jgi:hypothetical protein
MNKYQYFQTARLLCDFLNNSGQVNAVVAITFDASSGQLVLIYT